MTSRDLIRNIIALKPADRCGFWLGNPHADTLPIYHAYFGTSTLEQLHWKLGSDLRWISPQMIDSTYRHPRGNGLFDIWKYKRSLGEPGPLASCQSVEEINAYGWPSLDYLHFDETLDQLRAADHWFRASGFWVPFFHDIMDFFGVEGFMVGMHERPDLIHAALERICGFYYEANERFFTAAGDLIDGMFFGNDFGTQLGLLVSPAQLEDFIFPWFRRFTEQAHRFGLPVVLHSCGSIHQVIGTLIDAGVNCLHPLQALARNMDAETLARDFGGKIAFFGGIDTQDLLVNGTPMQVKEEVRRVRQILGPHLIISPSHEALLPNVPPQNVAAMAEAALES